jgi:hypothetical protein
MALPSVKACIKIFLFFFSGDPVDITGKKQKKRHFEKQNASPLWEAFGFSKCLTNSQGKFTLHMVPCNYTEINQGKD